jgi:predicted peptidase
MMIQGLGPAIQWDAARWPAIVVFPQKPSPASEWESHEAAVMALLERVRDEYNVDGARIYLTGMSQGGHGTWILGARHPELWAALAPVCGYAGARFAGAGAGTATPASLAGTLRTIPVWAFHGADDVVVPVAEATAMIDALKAAGAAPAPRLTIFPGVDHGSWDPAYRGSGLAEWLFAQHR